MATKTRTPRVDVDRLIRHLRVLDQVDDDFTSDRERKDAEKAILGAGYCPSCAYENHRARLRPWTPGNYYENAGRECMECEEFFPCGPQPEYGYSDGPSDADPGL